MEYKREVIQREIVHIDGKAYIRTESAVDFGEKNGTARVVVLDPCVSAEAQERRRQAVARKCMDLRRRGLI